MGANYHSERSGAGQMLSVRIKSAMIRVSEDVCCLNKIQTHRSMYFLISESNCFSTKTDNSVHVRATRLYHDNDDKADDETDYRKKWAGNQKKDHQDQIDKQEALLEQTWAVQKWPWRDDLLVHAGTKQAGCDDLVQTGTIGDKCVQNWVGGWGTRIDYFNCNSVASILIKCVTAVDLVNWIQSDWFTGQQGY